MSPGVSCGVGRSEKCKQVMYIAGSKQVVVRTGMYAQFSTRSGHRGEVNQAWTGQESIFHQREKVTKAIHSRVPGKMPWIWRENNGSKRNLKFLFVRDDGRARERERTRAKISLHVSTVTPACSLALNRTTTVALRLPFILSFSSWLATIGPTSWAGTSFLSDAISLHPIGPPSPA